MIVKARCSCIEHLKYPGGIEVGTLIRRPGARVSRREIRLIGPNAVRCIT